MKIKNKNGKITDVRLPIKFKTKWVEALRSGKFKQNTEGFLLIDDKYCCLGVACKITHPKIKLDKASLISRCDFMDKLKNIKVPKILKGTTDTTCNDYNPIVAQLTTMNDTGSSFKKIATYIEKNL